MSTAFPIVTLHPISDKRNAWAALLLETFPAPDAASLARIFGEFDLTEALDNLACVLVLPDLAALDPALPAGKIVLCLPAAFCCDPANAESLQALRAGGYRLMAMGLPLPGQELCPSVDTLALFCPGTEIPAGGGDWMGRLPGPHLALDAAPDGADHSNFSWWVRHAPAGSVTHATKGGDATNRALLLDLLAKVSKDADSHEIEAIVKRDPQLSYHLLKLVNSVGFALTTKITSFNQAITLLGRRQLQRWLQLLLYAHARKDDQANPLLPQAALRAGLAEALCARSGGSRDAQDRAFMAGMFSLLDVLFGVPLAEIMKPLNLADDVVAALTDRSGTLGALLRVVEAGESPDGAALAAALAGAGISAGDWAQALVHACRWAIQVSREA
jgi:EAL and modified HD-GYP domain-containing signal transduction protein